MPEGGQAQIEPRFYLDWLAIPEENCPPNHYELLGLPLYEEDQQLIAQSAQRRGIAVRRFQAGDHAQVARLIVYQLARAKACLTDPLAKAAYDATLRNLSATTKPTAARPLNQNSPGVSPRPQSPITPPTQSSSSTTGDASQDELPSLTPLAAVVDEMMVAASTRPPSFPHGAPPRAMARRPKAERDVPQQVLWVGGAIAAVIIVLLVVFRRSPPTPAVADAHPKHGSTAAAKTSPSDRQEGPPGGRKVKTSMPKNPATPVTPTVDPDSASDSSEESNSPDPPNPMPESALNINPFGQLVAEIDLPAIDAQSPPADAIDISLGELGRAPHADWQLTIERQACAKAAFAFEVMPTADAAATAGWDIHAKASDRAAAAKSALGGNARDVSRPVARLVVEQQQLSFRWNLPVESSLEKQLRACELRLLDGPHQHSIRLRALPVIPAIVLDLEQKKQTASVPTHGLGEQTDVYLEVLALEGVSAVYTTTPEDGKARLGSQVRLQLERGDAEIRVGLVGNAKSMSIVVTATYEVRGQDFELTATRLKDHLKGLRNKLDESQNLMADSRRLSSAIPFRIRELERSVEDRNGAGQAAALLEITQLRANLKTAEANIRRLSRSIPIAVADVKSVNEAAQVAERLHNRAALRLRVVAASNQGEIPILLAGSSNGEQPAPEDAEPDEPRNEPPDTDGERPQNASEVAYLFLRTFYRELGQDIHVRDLAEMRDDEVRAEGKLLTNWLGIKANPYLERTMTHPDSDQWSQRQMQAHFIALVREAILRGRLSK